MNDMIVQTLPSFGTFTSRWTRQGLNIRMAMWLGLRLIGSFILRFLGRRVWVWVYGFLSGYC